MNRYSIQDIIRDMIILIRNGQIIYQNRRIAGSSINPMIISNCIKNFAHSNVNEFFLQFTSMEKSKNVNNHKETINKDNSTKENEQLSEKEISNQEESNQPEKTIEFIETSQTTTDSIMTNENKKLYKAICAVIISTIIFLVVIFIVKASVDYATDCRIEINKSEEEEKIKLSQKMLGDYEIYSILS